MGWEWTFLLSFANKQVAASASTPVCREQSEKRHIFSGRPIVKERGLVAEVLRGLLSVTPLPSG